MSNLLISNAYICGEGLQVYCICISVRKNFTLIFQRVSSTFIKNQVDEILDEILPDFAEWLEHLTVNAMAQLSWVRSQHPPAQWNLRGGRLNSVEYHNT